MSTLDWVVVAVAVLVAVVLGLAVSRRGTRSLADFFIGGRTMPWWLLGTSMVATTFAADTPLAITEYVRRGGLWRNWFWWAAAIGHVLAVFLFARLWRRARVLTDNELIEFRYSGRPAAFLRGFKATYLATAYNLIVMGWVLNAMATVLQVAVDLEPWHAIWAASAIALVYTVTAGYWGVVVADLFQFVLAMVGCIVFATLAVSGVGGLSGLREGLAQAGQAGATGILPPLPPAGGGWTDLIGSEFFRFIILVTVLWWAHQGADGGGYFIQRMSSAKDERHAALGTLWFAVAHYALRFWPWALVALVSLVGVQDYSSDKAAYVEVLVRRLPAGLRGLMVAVFLSAFMSTINTHLNWGASYLVNDLYRRFLRPKAIDHHYVRIGQIASILLMLAAGWVAGHIGSIERAWTFVWSMGAGVGAVLILRWFWWRVNAWSEIAAIFTSLAVTLGLEVLAWVQDPAGYHLFAGQPTLGGVLLKDQHRALLVVPISTLVWLSVTFLTQPEPRAHLLAFFERVRPGGFWGPVADDVEPGLDRVLGWGFVIDWFAGLAMIYGALFGTGELLLGSAMRGTVFLGVAAFAAWWVIRRVGKRG